MNNMENTYTKIDDNTIQVQKTVTDVQVVTYDIKKLNDQLAAIQDQQDRDNAQRELEKSEVMDIITKASEMNA